MNGNFYANPTFPTLDNNSNNPYEEGYIAGQLSGEPSSTRIISRFV